MVPHVTSGQTWRIKYVWNLIVREKRAGTFLSSDIAQIAPFVETMGYVRTGRKESWWEREWRHREDFIFGYADIALGLCHEDRIDEFETFMAGIARRRDPDAGLVRFVDQRWGLEDIIDRLSRVSRVPISHPSLPDLSPASDRPKSLTRADPASEHDWPVCCSS